MGVRGVAGGRVNHGRLGPKDLFGWQANVAPDRLACPLVREPGPGGELVESDWETAMGLLVARSRALLAGPGGAERIAFYTSERAWDPVSKQPIFKLVAVRVTTLR